MRKLLLITACGLLPFGVAACGDDDDDGSATSGATGTVTGATTEKTVTTGGVQNRKVAMKDTQFNPRGVTVSKGTTITWTNDDDFDHNVTKESGPGPDFKSENYGKGKTYEQQFTTAGTIKYECTLHPGMEGTVTVK
jgi:plastocyanin